jgi:hypothetical protein
MTTHPIQYGLGDPAVISARVFDDEVVIASFATGVYYSLRFAAAEIWLGLMAGVPADRVVQAVAPHCSAAHQQSVDAAWSFIRALEDEQLIRPAERSIDESWQPRPGDGPFEPPAFERFTDMEDLLLLDPIHDVGKTGWPDLLRKG